MTLAEWESLSAESRAKINVYKMEFERLETRFGDLKAEALAARLVFEAIKGHIEFNGQKHKERIEALCETYQAAHVQETPL